MILLGWVRHTAIWAQYIERMLYVGLVRWSFAIILVILQIPHSWYSTILQCI